MQFGLKRSRRGGCDNWEAVPIGTGSWGGKGGCRVSGKGFLTGVHARFAGCPY